MRGYDDLILEANADPEALLISAGIPLAALVDDELRISVNSYAQLLEDSAERIQCPDIGLKMALHQDISILGPIAIAMQNAATIGEGIVVCERFLHTHSSGIRLTIHSGQPKTGITTLRLTLLLPTWVPSRQLMDQCVADLYHFVAWLAEATPPVLAIHLPHEPLAAVACYEAFFDCAPQFSQTDAEIHLPTAFFEQEMHGASQAMHKISVEYLQLRYAASDQTVGQRVEDVLKRALSSTRGRRDVVAQLLSMHPRTLQRRLAAEGRSYQEILDSVRKAEIRRWLTETDVALAQVAGLVGLADQTVLTRNCNRWFGETPGQIRGGNFTVH
jgi:AraC-like DNA-binding protein